MRWQCCLPSRQLQESVATKFDDQIRVREILKAKDMFGTTETVIGARRDNFCQPLFIGGLTSACIVVVRKAHLVMRCIQSAVQRPLTRADCGVSSIVGHSGRFFCLLYTMLLQKRAKGRSSNTIDNWKLVTGARNRISGVVVERVVE